MTLEEFQNLSISLEPYRTEVKLPMTDSEKAMMMLFVTNVSKQIFAFNPLAPTELVGGVISRASRSNGDLRNVMMRDFFDPLLLTDHNFQSTLQLLVGGDVDLSSIHHNPQARKFFVKWYSAYGDKSIADVVSIAFGMSKISLLTTRLIMQSRPGFAAIEKSGRYLDLGKVTDGELPFFVPPDLKKWGLFEKFQSTMEIILEKFGLVKKKYRQILDDKYSGDLSVTKQMLATKVFDDLRHLIPLCIHTQFGMNLSAREAEYLIGKLISSNLGEMKFVGMSMFEEAKQIIPSLMTSLVSPMGLEYLTYMTTQAQFEKELASTTIGLIKPKFEVKSEQKKRFTEGSVTLISHDQFAEERIIASILFKHGHGSFDDLLKYTTTRMTSEMKGDFFDKLFSGRKYRFYTPSRDFEMPDITFEFNAPGTVVKDLRRHRMCSIIEQKLLTPEIGYRPDVFKGSEFLEINNIMDQIYLLSRSLHTEVAQFSEETAQYALLQGNMTKWVAKINLRSFFQQVELRTSSQGATDYREIMMSVARIVNKLYPNLAKHLLVDYNEYDFARRGEDVTAENRLVRLQKGMDILTV